MDTQTPDMRIQDLLKQVHVCIVCGKSFKDLFLKCSICYSKTCICCLKLILSKENVFDHDIWCYEVNSFFTTNVEINKFMGHYYEMKYMWRKHIQLLKSNHQLVDGYLIIFELNLILDSPLNSIVDMYGFEKGDKNIVPLLHCVVGYDLARFIT